MGYNLKLGLLEFSQIKFSLNTNGVNREYGRYGVLKGNQSVSSVFNTSESSYQIGGESKVVSSVNFLESSTVEATVSAVGVTEDFKLILDGAEWVVSSPLV